MKLILLIHLLFGFAFTLRISKESDGTSVRFFTQELSAMVSVCLPMNFQVNRLPNRVDCRNRNDYPVVFGVFG